MILSLRPYQEKCIADIRLAFRQGHQSVLFQSPTASGKTVIFAFITEAAAAKGNRVIIMMHRQEILLQTSRALLSLGVPHGLIAPRFTPTKELVQVASVQTLVRRLDKFPVPELIVIDEAHHTVAGSWRKIIEHFPKAKILGVTATPHRLDGKGLGRKSGGFYDTLVLGPSVTDLIEQGYLSKPVVYAPPTGINLSGVHRRFGDYVQSEVEEIIDKPKITGSAVEHYGKICPGAPAIAFCVSVAHAEHVAGKFNDAGIPSLSIDGKLNDAERKDRIDALASGRIRVLTSCEIVSEGTDIPIVTAAILLRPTQSLALHLQQVGRVLRIHPEKERSIILDHVGNTFRHGFPDDEREWSLVGAKDAPKKGNNGASPYIQCDMCYAVFMRTLPACPECGFVRQITPRKIEQVDGELREITRRERERVQRDRRREVARARTEDELRRIARERGYKPGWVYQIMRARGQRITKREKEEVFA